MCGISAIVAPRAESDLARDVLRMHAPIRHRGPDGEGVLVINGTSPALFHDAAQIDTNAPACVAAAFRRLKIIDLSDAAAQPMPSDDRQRWILFNGEIYNFRVLRSELQRRGRAFHTSGDTEVVLAAYEVWGEKCFERLEGMWAIVLIDLARRRVVVSRDRFGIKPLYWANDRGRILLASEIRQILAVLHEKPRANARLVRSFLRGDRDTVLEETFFEGIRSVPPGNWFELPLDPGEPFDVRFRAYWDLAEHSANGAAPSYRDAVSELGELMAASLESHRVADVRVGSLLSGGLDSSIVATLLTRGAAGGPSSVPTFSFGFREAAPEYCELRYVDALKQREGMTNFQTTFDADWIARNAERVVDSLEEPPLAVPAFAQFKIFELCREHDTTVVLDGQGSDEIFAGYPYHERLLLLDYARHLRLPSLLGESRAIAVRESISTARLLRKAFIDPPLYRVMQRIRRSERWIARDYGVSQSGDYANGTSEGGRQTSIVNRRLHHDVKWGNVKIILAYADKNAMRFSIEARVPYFDRRLVEFAFRLPAEYKVGSATRKRVLRDFARTFLPAEITERRDRMGFAVPDAVWMRKDLMPAVREAVLRSEFENNSCFAHGGVAGLLRDFERGRVRDYRAVWRVWMLALWQQRFTAVI